MSKEKFKTTDKYSGSHGSHGYSTEETESARNFINHRLGNDPDLKHLLPIDETEDVFKAVGDGLVLCKLMNVAVKGTIDTRSINTGKLNKFTIIENLNLAINSARGIGCNLTNIGPDDLMAGTPHLVIKIGLMQHITLKEHPELIALLEEGETLDDLLGLPPEQILIRWVNYHLKAAGSNKRIKNFGRDISDSEAYTILLKQVTNGVCNTSPLKENDLTDRAEKMLQQAEKIECREFVSPGDVVAGNTRLNFCFVANLFNRYPALDQPEEEEIEEIIEKFDDDLSREERNYKHWIESLGYDVSDFYEDLSGGVILLKLEETIKPGSVDWRGIKMNPRRERIMELVGNNQYMLKIAKDKIGCKIVSIGGNDIAKKNKKLILAVVWQLMRAHSIALLEEVGGGKKINEKDLISWANSINKTPHTCRSFRDKRLGNAEYLIHLIKAISPKSVDTKYVNHGSSPDDKLENASYAISCARKIGATIFLTTEDIVEVKQKCLLTFFAALMKVYLERQ